MVIHKRTAESKYPKNISQPNRRSQRIFMIGCLPKFTATSFPNGASINPANLKHCLPKGIPIMVIHKRSPKINQEIAVKSPPKRIQIMFPNTDEHPD